MIKMVVITDVTPVGDLYLCRGEKTKYLRQHGPDGYVTWSAARQFAGAWEVDEPLPAGAEIHIVNRSNELLYSETLEAIPGIDTPVAEQRAPFAREAVKAMYDEYKEKYGLVDHDVLRDWLMPYAEQCGFEGSEGTWMHAPKYLDVDYSEPESRELLGHTLKVARWDYVHRVCNKKYSAFEVQTNIGSFAWPSGYMIQKDT